MEIDLESPETLDDYYIRGKTAMQGAVRDTEAEGMFIVDYVNVMKFKIYRVQTMPACLDPLTFYFYPIIGGFKMATA